MQQATQRPKMELMCKKFRDASFCKLLTPTVRTYMYVYYVLRSSTGSTGSTLGPQVTKYPRIFLPLGEKALKGLRSCNFALFKNTYSRCVTQKRGFSTPPRRHTTCDERIFGTKNRPCLDLKRDAKTCDQTTAPTQKPPS